MPANLCIYKCMYAHTLTLISCNKHAVCEFRDNHKSLFTTASMRLPALAA